MWTYSQTTGDLSHDGQHVGTGYSGFGPGLDNPAMETVADVGPIPQGLWNIDRWDAHHGEKGPIVGVLSPVGHDAHGRSEFLIHGDNEDENHTASHGCVILGPSVRKSMRDSGDNDLTVTA